MLKSAIKVVMATIGIFAIVLAATVMLIDASMVDMASSREPMPGRCRAPGQLSLPRAPLLLENNSALAPDTSRHLPHALLARRANLEG